MIKHPKEHGNGRRKVGGRRRKTLSPGRVKSFFLADIEVSTFRCRVVRYTYLKFRCMHLYTLELEAYLQDFMHPDSRVGVLTTVEMP